MMNKRDLINKLENVLMVVIVVVSIIATINIKQKVKAIEELEAQVQMLEMIVNED